MPPASSSDVSDDDRGRITSTMLALLHDRGPEKTICPSDVARACRDDGWRELMPAVRRVAHELSEEGQVEVTQGGEQVNPLQASGPIRLCLTSEEYEHGGDT